MRIHSSLVLGCALTFIALSCALPLSAQSTASLEFEPVARAGNDTFRAVFGPDEAPLLAVRLLPGKITLSQPQLSAQVFNFWNQPAGRVDILPDSTPGQYLLKPQVTGPGWFKLELTLRDQGSLIPLRRKKGLPGALETYHYLPFAIVPTPLTATQCPDSPFGIDTAISSSKGLPFSLQADLVGWSGCRWVRDRISWTKCNPAPGEFTWEPYRRNALELQKRNVRILQVFQNCPEWTRAANAGAHSFPENLQAAFAFAQSAATALQPAVQAFEIWNEEDIAHFASDPPDLYSSMLKAMALGFQAATPAPTILLGPIARDPRVGGYDEVLKANQIAPYLDGYSFHTYQPTETGLFAKVLQTHQDIHRNLGFSGRALWLTETAWPYARNEIPVPEIAMRDQVRFLNQAYMTALGNGIRPVFWFLLRPHIGGGPSQFGLLDSQLCPLPVYAAYAVMTQKLGIATYLGSFRASDSEIHLFHNGTSEVAVILAARTTDRVDLPPLGPDARAFNVMGAPLAVQRDAEKSSLATGGYAVYIQSPDWKKRAALKDSLVAPATTPPQFPAEINRAVVLQALYPRRFIANESGKSADNWDGIATNWAPRGYTFNPGDSIPVSVQVYNFSDTTVSGRIRVELPTSFQVNPAFVEVTVPAQGKTTASFTIATPSNAGLKPSLWSITGSLQGKSVTPSVSRWTPTTP